MIVTLLDVAAAGAHIYIALAGIAEQRTLIAGYALHTAAVTGAISLGLAFAAFKIRQEKPPPKVTKFSVLVASAPIVAIVLAALRA